MRPFKSSVEEPQHSTADSRSTIECASISSQSEYDTFIPSSSSAATRAQRGSRPSTAESIPLGSESSAATLATTPAAIKLLRSLCVDTREQMRLAACARS
eukprot:CAMPEP_0206256008 /NCGR_PEP_ID=MMETSP0047_2-20121206/24540_1 /ASSEMBLY_ACC=CAM_ASM_000192 /TAXON_ID=195065 /ORGANISM="Chroomonas mesostigmatica_cf, Strain CCMP1168" /LENGTH=99 /DNA_ID=CAMNT_0053682423 /DNA_START=190 /DNA_END=489 /DNA_ORIENTATION=-